MAENKQAPQQDETLDNLNNSLTSAGEAIVKNSKMIGALMAQGKKEEAEEMKKQVSEAAQRLAELEEKEAELSKKVTDIMKGSYQIMTTS